MGCSCEKFMEICVSKILFSFLPVLSSRGDIALSIKWALVDANFWSFTSLNHLYFLYLFFFSWEISYVCTDHTSPCLIKLEMKEALPMGWAVRRQLLIWLKFVQKSLNGRKSLIFLHICLHLRHLGLIWWHEGLNCCVWS